MTNGLDPSLDLYVKAILGRKAMGLVILDVRELTSVADVFIICSGRSNRQVTAIADFIQLDLKKHGIKPLSVEGKKEGQGGKEKDRESGGRHESLITGS